MAPTAPRKEMVWTRLDPEDKADLQAMADERYDGILALAVRIPVKRALDEWRKTRRTEGEAA